MDSVIKCVSFPCSSADVMPFVEAFILKRIQLSDVLRYALDVHRVERVCTS